MPSLTFNLVPSDDEELTCFFCGKQGVDHEFSFREDDRFGARRHMTIGVHLACTEGPPYRLEEKPSDDTNLYPKNCPDCGYPVVPTQKEGRVITECGVDFTLPADFSVPTCTGCDEEYWDWKLITKLEQLMGYEVVE